MAKVIAEARAHSTALRLYLWLVAVSFIQPPGLLVGPSEVVAGGQGGRVGLARDLLAVGESALGQRDGLGQASPA